MIESKIRFIKEFIDGTITIIQKEDDEIEKMLEDSKYPKFASETNENKFSFDYLLNILVCLNLNFIALSVVKQANKIKKNEYID